MNDREAVKELKQINSCGDVELAHIEADKLLCALLRESHPLTVEAFELMNKWYA